MKPLVAVCALLLALTVAGHAQLIGARPGEDWSAAYLPQWELSIRVPPGWLLDSPLEGEVTRFHSPQGTEVLLRVWSGADVLTSAEAAAEYQQALGVEEAVDPPPQPLRTAAGLEGFWMNLPEVGSGRPLLSAAVFSSGTRRVALAVRGVPGYEAAAQARLEAMAVSLIVAPGPPLAPPPVSPPVPPPVAPPAPLAEGGTVTAAAGAFTLTVPAAARVAVERGTVWVDYPQGKAGYFLWPARIPAGASVTDLPAAWAVATGHELIPGGQRRTPEGLVYTGTLTRGARHPALLFAWQQDESALVLGVYGAAADREYLPQLAALLGQATGPGWRPAELPVPAAGGTWVEASGELALALPENWEARGGVRYYQKSPVLDLTARGEDILVTWRQPYTPAFRDLTPILEARGETEGARYREDDQEDYLVVLARRNPEKFVAWLLQAPDAGLRSGRLVRAETSPAVAALLPGPQAEREGAVVWVAGTREGEPREGLYLCATAPLPLERGAFRWQAAVLSVEYPAGRSRSALAALQALLTGAAPARPEGELGKTLAAYREAAVAAAAQVAPPVEGGGPWPLLSEEYVPAAEAPRWSVAPGLAAWRALVEDPEGLPELKENW